MTDLMNKTDLVEVKTFCKTSPERDAINTEIIKEAVVPFLNFDVLLVYCFKRIVTVMFQHIFRIPQYDLAKLKQSTIFNHTETPYLLTAFKIYRTSSLKLHYIRIA